MQRIDLQSPPSRRLPHEEAPHAGHAFEHDHPLGAPVIAQAVVVTGVGLETLLQPLPDVIPEEPSISEGSAAVVVFRTTVQETTLQLGVIRDGSVAPRGRIRAVHFLPGSAVEQPGVAQWGIVGVDSAKEYGNPGLLVKCHAMAGTRRGA